MRKPRKKSTTRAGITYTSGESDQVRALRGLGLTDVETRTYLALLESPGPVAAVARSAGLRRSQVYVALPRLEALALAGVVPRGKRRIYVAEPPARLLQLAARAATSLEALLPDLELAYRRPGGVPTVRTVQGVEAIKALHDQMVESLPKNGAYYRFSSPTFEGGEKKYLSRTYKTVRNAKQLQRFIITNVANARRKKPDLNREIRIVPDGPAGEKPFAYNITMVVYGTTVELIDYNSDLALVIEDRLAANFVKHIFLLLYERLPTFEPKR